MLRRNVTIIFAILWFAVTPLMSHAAAPPLPASLYGIVTLNEADIPAGTTVSAWINGVQYAEISSAMGDGRSVFLMDVPADDPDTTAVEGGVAGDTIIFQVDGVQADQTAVWAGGTHVRLDLTATVSPQAPVADNQNVTTAEDTGLSITLTASDVNEDDLLTYEVVTQPANGQLSGTPPQLTYTPNLNYNGADSFTFQANDGTFDSNVATVSITISPEPDAPVVDPIADVTLDEDATLDIAISATDPDGDSLTLTASNLPPFATLTDNGDNTGTVSLAPGFDDASVYANITITASDGTLSASETFTITVNDGIAPPQAAFVTDIARVNEAAHGRGARVVDYSSEFVTINNPYAPQHVIEDDLDEIWRSAHTQITDQYITVQLVERERTTLLASVEVLGGDTAEGMRNFDVQVSTTGIDDADFTTVLSAEAPNSTLVTRFDFTPVEATYVRLVARDNWGDPTHVSVAHFAAFTREQQGGIVSLLEGPAASVVDISSVTAPNVGDNLLDESTSTTWSSDRTQITDQWIVVDLAGKTREIDRIRLVNNVSNTAIRDFTVSVSTTTTDPSAFTQVFSGSAAMNTNLQTFSFAPVQARYLRLDIANNHGNTLFMVMRTLDVLTPDGVDVARLGGVAGAIVDASTTYTPDTNQDPSRAIDASPTTTWASFGADNQWFTVRLLDGEEVLIDRVRLRGSIVFGTVRDFTILVSTTGLDDSDFVPAFSGTLPRGNEYFWFEFEPVQARYVRFLAESSNAGPGQQSIVPSFEVYTSDRGGAQASFLDISTTDSGEITSWLWDFGDGINSTEQHPQHTYAAPGTYMVTLTATTSQGIANSWTAPYHVLVPPQADFDWSPVPPLEGGTAQPITFNDQSSSGPFPILGWDWHFSHVNDVETQNPASMSFPDNGEYSVTFTATDSQYLSATSVKTIDIENRIPTGVIRNSPVIVWGQEWAIDSAAGDSSPVDQLTLKCTWDFGDGNGTVVQPCDSISSSVPYSYSLPGIYTAELTVEDKDGGTKIDTTNVTVNRRSTLLLNYYIRSITDREAEVKVGLLDLFDLGESMSGYTINLTLETSQGTQTVSAITDEIGVATAQFDAIPGEIVNVTSSYDGDIFYLPAEDDVDERRVYKQLIPGDIVFVIDESDSMGDDHERVKQSVDRMVVQFASVLQPRFGLVGYGSARFSDGRGEILTRLTSNVDLLRGGLDKLETSGSIEPAFHAIERAMADQMDIRQGVGICNILFTDEPATPNIRPNSTTETTKEDAINALLGREAVFVGIVSNEDAVSPRDFGPNPDSIVDAVGGEVFDILEFRENPGPVFSAAIDTCIETIFTRAKALYAIDKSNDTSVVDVGVATTYTITLLNAGIHDLTGLVITDTLPVGATYIAASDNPTMDAGKVVWQVPSLPVGQEVKRTVTIRIDSPLPGQTTITNTVETIDDGIFGVDPFPEDNIFRDVDTLRPEPIAQLTIIKQASPADGKNFIFSSDVSGHEGFLLDDADVDDGDSVANSLTMNVPVDSTVEVSEIVPAGWELVDASCTGPNGAALVNSSYVQTDATLSITLGGVDDGTGQLVGEEVTCIFSNERTVVPVWERMEQGIESFAYDSTDTRNGATLGTLHINFNFTYTVGLPLEYVYFEITTADKSFLRNPDGDVIGLGDTLPIPNADLPNGDQLFTVGEKLTYPFEVGVTGVPWTLNFVMYAYEVHGVQAAARVPLIRFSLNSSMFDAAYAPQSNPMLYLPLFTQFKESSSNSTLSVDEDSTQVEPWLYFPVIGAIAE
ncbi:MAG: discoidin domain-containing protein [Chloroflexota bacterium]